MARVPFDAQERRALCEQFERLGPDAPTLITAWSAHDLAAHLVLRERDLLAGPCVVLPGPFARFAERRRIQLVRQRDFGWLVERIRSGPPPGFFRLEWVRSLANLNEFFIHHEDLRRANDLPPRTTLTPELENALWRNVCRSGRYLSRGLRGVGLQLLWVGTTDRMTLRSAYPCAQLSGRPGELLLFLFGRQDAAQVDVMGPDAAVAAVHRTHFGM